MFVPRLFRTQFNMKRCVFLFVLGTLLHDASSTTHSMMYIVTAASGLDEFPQHNEVGLVNGQVFVHYDSKLGRIVPKTDWIAKNVDADYWRRETQRNINTQEVFKANVGIAMARFNQTDGVHIVQFLYGCELDDETNRVTGYDQFGYDGEDFVAFNLETQTWIAPNKQAVISKFKWDRNKANNAHLKNYLTQECPEWLKKYVVYGKSSLMRKELPSVSLLQKSSSSPVSCHATGFYPDRAMMFWTKDGEEVHENVEPGEILPNHDGTFQMSVDLDVSSVKPEDWERYSCVFQLSGVRDIFTKLDTHNIRSNEKTNMTIIIAAVVVGLCVGLVAVLGFILYKKKNGKRSSSPLSESEEELNPKGSQ